MSAPIKVIVIDDSALIRKLLTEILNQDPQIEVVATAADPYDAREKIKRFNPDVLTLDVEMPKMDGITFLRNLMRLRPMPVVMISTLTEQGAEVSLEALALGAVEVIAKPRIDVDHSMRDYAEHIISTVKMAAATRVQVLDQAKIAALAKKKSLQPNSANSQFLNTTDKVIAIGASTGGTEAIKAVLMDLPVTVPGVVVTQHIPAAFSAAFAARVNSLCAITVCQAEDGQPILPGHAYIAPGDKHLQVTRSGARYYCKLNDGELVNRHKPSVDVLFKSVAEHVGPNAIGVMLTGMGKDGAEGMLAMKKAGAFNLVQDEKTSVVWGMPGAAFNLGAAEHQYPLDRIAAAIVNQLQGKA